MGQKYVLAMYDIRGKQNFIYRSRKCKEIIGGSHIIADLFVDYLYPSAREYCHAKEADKDVIYRYARQGTEKEPFSSDEFQKRMDSGDYLGEVVYEGGGNFLVLYRDGTTCVEINKIFTRKLLEKLDTLKVLCTYVEIENFDHFESDRQRLYREHRINEAQESVIYPVNTLPFVQTSPESGRPFTGMFAKTRAKAPEKVTTEELAKYGKYDDYLKVLKSEERYDKEEFLLDNLVTERGNESLLAVIYIDGNSMGAKVQECLKGLESYDECVTKLRDFSAGIEQNYVKDRIEAVNAALEEKYSDKKKVRRTIVAAGDEMTIICNARDALDVVKAYFRDMLEGSSCAGIAVFHSHAPYSDAYRIAEECCESGKKMMKAVGVSNANLVDFHYCQSGIGISLEHIRNREMKGRELSRPWRLDVDRVRGGYVQISPVFKAGELKESQTEGFQHLDQVHQMAENLNCLGRSNVKTLREAAEAGSMELEMELKRINAHRKPEEQIDFALNGRLGKPEERQKLIYDISIVYDLWFRGEEQHDKDGCNAEN